ncbi:hypothetical protein [Chitinophaga silvatica]|uniref:hypothetical protein n=1 Tax=Chitinophaga silvatica TaxID=2282649 RepID=UPI0013142048|nr:hypothetical protein [Chitinophaga silvatica]
MINYNFIIGFLLLTFMIYVMWEYLEIANIFEIDIENNQSTLERRNPLRMLLFNLNKE